MKSLVISGVLMSTLAAFGQSEVQHPEWMYKIRMVSVHQKPREGKFDADKFYQRMVELKKQGVNTVMDHGSLQFLPDLPDEEEQWKMQVDYDVAIPYSQAVKKAGLRLFHHTTSTFAPIEALKNPKYKEWASLDMHTGKTALSKGYYEDACYLDLNHPEFRKTLFSRMAEYARRCKVDGWMTDEVEWLPDIYACGSKEGSWKKYRELYGRDYPKPPIDYSDPHWREYLTFRFDSGGDFYRELLKELQKENPKMLLSGCVAGISAYHRRIWAMGSQNWLKGWNWGFYEMEEGHCKYGKRAGFFTTTFWPKYYREMALYNANGEANGWPCSYALVYPRRFKVENSELFYGWAMTLSMGFRCWMSDDQAEPEWFAWESKFEEDLVKPKLIGDVGIYFPEWTRDFGMNPPEADEEDIARKQDTQANDEVGKGPTEEPAREEGPREAYDNWSGVSEALAHENVMYDQLIRWHLDDVKRLERFKVIILPSSFYLTDTMASTLKTFISNGGTIVAVGECAAVDPFGKKNYGNAMISLLGISSRSIWIDGAKSFKLEKEIYGIPAGTYQYPNGLLKVKPAQGAEVLASIDDVPALIYNKSGKGQVYYFPGRLGTSLFNNMYQGTVYQSTDDVAGRKQFAGLVTNLLKMQRRVEVHGLPSKVMVNAYDTDGNFDGKYKRTIHFLDSYDGFEDGEVIPNPGAGWEGNAVCRFKQFAQRNAGKTVEIVLRDLKKLTAAKMISPDFKSPKILSVRFDKSRNGYVISINPKEFGRYSVVIVEK